MKVVNLFLFVLASNILFAQDVESLYKSKWYTHSGKVSLSQVLSADSRHKQSFFVLAGDYTPQIRGVSLPFSFSYSDNKTSFSNPFNQWRIAPSFRWAKAQFGVSSLNYSPYTLSGLQFNGGGLELSPAKNYISIMAGTVINDYSGGNPEIVPPLTRFAYGFKFARKTNQYQFSTSFLSVKDTENKDMDISPKENIALSLNYSYKIAKRMTFDMEFASSSLTHDTYSEKIKTKFKLKNLSDLFLSNNISTQTSQAYKVSIGIPFLNISYERVEPDYQTLGTYYVRNDFQNLTINANYSSAKLSGALRLGLEENDLENRNRTKNKQFVVQSNIQMSFNSNTRIFFNYSNFRTSVFLRNHLQELEDFGTYNSVDSLVLSRVLQLCDLGFHYTIPQKSKSYQYLSSNLSYQKTDINSYALNLAATYGISVEKTFQLGFSLLSNLQNNNQTRTFILAPSIFYTKYWLAGKGLLKLSLSENLCFFEEKSRQTIWALRTDLLYKIKEKHLFSINLSQQLRNDYRLMLSLSYQLNFSSITNKRI